MPVRVALESVPKRTFVIAVDWPGWCRSARIEAEALEALLGYAPRYAEVARRAGLDFAAPASVDDFHVMERVAGDASTEFGVPGRVGGFDGDPLTPDELDRQLRLMRAAWDVFDDAADRHRDRQLRLGPRGGGRQVRKIEEHVAGGQDAYLTAAGSRRPDDRSPAAIRDAFVEAVAARASGRDLPAPNKTSKPWPPRYAIRRSAWHALDHAWEIEDRSE